MSCIRSTVCTRLVTLSRQEGVTALPGRGGKVRCVDSRTGMYVQVLTVGWHGRHRFDGTARADYRDGMGR